MPPSQGLIPFDVPSAPKPCHTWYKVVGDLSNHAGPPPLITIHGGPGAGHEYLLPMAELHRLYNIPVIFYDQLGNGQATRIPEKNGDESFWTFELFERELDNLISFLELDKRPGGYDVLGQSWGGMLASVWAPKHPKGLRRLILANAAASVPILLEGEHRLVKELPQHMQDTLAEADAKGEYESEAYEHACIAFYQKHLCRVDPWPQELVASLGHLKDDPTVYKTMFGPSELVSTGNMKDWSGIETAHQINVPTLLLNGRHDEIRDDSIMPFFERIPRVRWVTMENSSHTGWLEEQDRWMEVVGNFLTG